MEAPAAGKTIGRLDDPAARGLDLGLGCSQVVGIEDDQPYSVIVQPKAAA
jgi:hypothetical protein